MKNRNNTIDKIMFFILLITSIVFLPAGVFGEKVSFEVPTTHEKYQLIDSLFKVSDSLEKKMKKMEITLIKDKKVRTEQFEVKGQYFDFLLKNKKTDIATIRIFCDLALTCYEAKESYFKELISALEGNSRGAAFSYLKGTRIALGQVKAVIARYDVSEEPAIQRGKHSLGDSVQ